MGKRQELSESAAILLVATVFIAAGVIGHLALPAIDAVWIVIVLFGVMAVGQGLRIRMLGRQGEER